MTDIKRIDAWRNETLNKMGAEHQNRMNKLDTLDAKLENASREETIDILRQALNVCNISGGSQKMTFNL